MDYKHRDEILDEVCQNFDLTIDIKNFYLKISQMREMQENGMIFGIHTINHLVLSRLNHSEQKIEILDGWGKLSADNLKKSIEKSKNISLDKFIFSLGIRHIGQENAKLLSQHFLNIKNFSTLTKNFNFDSLSSLDGIGETQIGSLKNFFSDKINLDVVKKLIAILNIRSVIQNKKGKLLNKTFMFTGKLSSISRAEAKSLTEENSGKILSNVSKKLDYLVIGEKPTAKKVKQAKELNIKVISQLEWEKILN